MRTKISGADLWDNKHQQRLDYIMVLVLVCYSGNPFFLFMPLVREAHIALTILFAVVLFARRKSQIIAEYFLYVLPIIFIMLCHMMMIGEASISTNLYILMKMFIGVSVIGVVGKRFIYVYVNTMVVLTAISFLCWLYNNMFGLIPGGVPVSEICNSVVFYTQDIFHVQNGATRNTGMFWEAGAHQGFLNLALLFLTRLDDIDKRRIKVIILFLGVLTTQSTTGYIVLMCVCLMYVYENKKIDTLYKALLIIALLAASYYVYTELSFLGDKIEDNLSDKSSSQGRITDFYIYEHLIKERPLIGNSYNSEVTTGNGFFYQIVSIGFLGTLYLFSFLFYRVQRKTSLKFASLFLIIIIVMFQGEVFVTMPLFMALPFIVFPKQSKIKSF